MHTLAPVAPDVFLENISDGKSSENKRVTIQWTSSGMAHYKYFITVNPPIPECMNSSVCSTSSTKMDFDVEIGTEYSVSVQAQRCEARVMSEESQPFSFQLTGSYLLF